MSIRTSWRARTGMPTRLHEAHGTSTIDQNTTPHGRHRTAVRAGVLAIAAALTVTLAPAAGAQAATPAAATVTATSAASTATKTTAKVHLKASKKTWVKGKKAAKVTAKVRTGAAPPGGTVTFYDGGKRLKKKTVGASGTVSYRLPRKLSAKKHTIRAVFRPSAQTAAVVAEPKRKLSYKDARELELLPARIEQLEADIAARTASMNEPKFYQQDSATILAFNEASAKLHAELEHAYQRWNELDA